MTLPGEVIHNGQLRCVPNEGMPMYKNPFEKGKLIIQFRVEFPPSLPQDVAKQLERLLPPRPIVNVPADAEEALMIDFNPEYENSRGRYRQEAYDDDEEHPGHQGGNVQCATN